MKKRNQKTTTEWPASFTAHDRAMFERIRVSAELATDAGITRMTDREARNHGIRCKGDMAGLAIPYADLDTGDMVTLRLRRDHPDKTKGGKIEAKYVMPPNAKRLLYYPPGAREALEKRADILSVLVESEKAALAGTGWAERMGFGGRVIFIAMGGCWGWSAGDKEPLPDMKLLEGKSVCLLLDANVATNGQVRLAQDTLVAQLRAWGCSVSTLQLPQMPDVNGPDDLIAQENGDELMKEVFAVGTKAVVAPTSDDALATKFAEEQKDDIRYVPAWVLHFLWDGLRWKEDDVRQTSRRVQDFCLKEAEQCGSLSEAKRIRSRRTIEAVQSLAGAKSQMAASIDQWDMDIWTLATPGGAVDLRTGKLHEARREDYCTKLAGATPDASVVPKRWFQYLDEVTGGNKELPPFLQRVYGYCLTGDTSAHAFFFLYGMGANGKSVFVNTLLGILGDYAAVAPMEVFTATHNSQHPTSLAALRGARLAAATETEDGQRWAESKLKSITGGEPITARRMRQDEFTYTPQFKPMLSGNHRPQLRNVDEAMRRRIHLVPFEVTIPESDRDPHLDEKLRAEWGGILHWAIEGCLAWQKIGLNPPQAVTAATRSYMEEQDILGQWLEEKTEKGDREKPGELYENYKRWAETRGEYYKLSQKQFSQKLAERGFASLRSDGLRYIVGIRLKRPAMGPTARKFDPTLKRVK